MIVFPRDQISFLLWNFFDSDQFIRLNLYIHINDAILKNSWNNHFLSLYQDHIFYIDHDHDDDANFAFL